jgi:biotin operon repressor
MAAGKKWYFSKLPASVVNEGLWAKMKGAKQGVFVVLCHHANRHQCLSWPGVKRIGKSSGYSRRMVQSALRELQELGVIIDSGRRTRKGNRVFEIPGLRPPNENESEMALAASGGGAA